MLLLIFDLRKCTLYSHWSLINCSGDIKFFLLVVSYILVPEHSKQVSSVKKQYVPEGDALWHHIHIKNELQSQRYLWTEWCLLHLKHAQRWIVFFLYHWLWIKCCDGIKAHKWLQPSITETFLKGLHYTTKVFTLLILLLCISFSQI